VLVRIERRDDLARIVVSDTGTGIAREFLPHVFERFRQADGSTTRRHGGLGLGLAIVRHIVEVHGGTVSADSAGAGQGATFTVEIPISAESGRHDGASDGETDGVPRPLRGVRVLVVDDEADARELMKVILEQAGARVVAVDSAAAALTAVDTVHPAVLISDIAMPGDDGYTLLGTLRERGIDIPAVAVTAYGRPEDRQRAVSAGFQLHVPKPIEPKLFVDAVRALVEGSGR